MLFLRFICSFLLCLCVFCQGCSKAVKTDEDIPKSKFVVINKNFTAEKLNEKVIVSEKIAVEDLKRKDLKELILKNSFKVNQKQESILLGLYRQCPEAWFYTQIINTDSLSHQLVVDEFNHIRCDAFEIFTFKDGNSKKWGSITRSTPFSDYQIPFLTYAIPISISPKDTLNLLIHTQRNYGVHEVNLSVSSYKYYLGENIYHFLSKIFQVIIFVICTLMMFILGRVFDYKAMIYLGFYLISLMFVLLSSWGFIDTMVNFTTIGLSANNVSTFTVFVACITINPFFFELMKVVPKNEKRFKTIIYIFTGANVLLTCCYFLPIGIFHKIDIYLPKLMIISSLLSLSWLFFWSLIALFRSKIYYLIIGFSIAFLPYFGQQVFRAFEKSPIFVAKIFHPTFIFLAIGFTIICIYLLREKLVTRKKYEEDFRHLKVTLDEIRKNEIENIGRNLHDNVGNILATVLGYLNLKNNNVVIVENLVKEAIKEIRFLSHNLVKNENLPIKIKIERLTEHFNQFSNINYFFSDYSNEGINKITAEQQTNLYYIIQEIFTNTLKHSFATDVILQIFEDQKHLWITIEDDGIGMENQDLKKGIGLTNIHKRVQLSGFTINIDSTTKGTNTSIEILL